MNFNAFSLFQSMVSLVIQLSCSAVTQSQITPQEKTSSQYLGSSSLLLQVSQTLSLSFVITLHEKCKT